MLTLIELFGADFLVTWYGNAVPAPLFMALVTTPLAANELRGTFAQCSTAVKTTVSRLFHANACLPIVEQIHTD